MVVGLLIDLTIVKHQAHSSGSRLGNKKTGDYNDEGSPTVVLLDEASINTLLDLVFNLVDLVLRSSVEATPHYRAFKLGLKLELVHLHQLFTRERSRHCPKYLLILVDRVSQTRVKVEALLFF